MEENDVESTCGETKIDFGIEKGENVLIHDLRSRENFNSKSDALWIF